MKNLCRRRPLFEFKIGHCRGRNWLNGTQASGCDFVTSLLARLRNHTLRPGFHLQQTVRPRHKKQRNYMLSSHPSHQLLCFDSKLVIVLVEIGFMETRLKGDDDVGFSID